MKAAILSMFAAVAGITAARDSLLGKRDAICEPQGTPANRDVCTKLSNMLRQLGQEDGASASVNPGCDVLKCEDTCGIPVCIDGPDTAEVPFITIADDINTIMDQCPGKVKGQVFHKDEGNWNVLVKGDVASR